jgi:hypothetical protein
MSHPIHLILSSGTRVVIRNDANRIGGGQHIPAGAVAVSPLREGELRVRLHEHRNALLAIKRGNQPWAEVNAWRKRLHKEFDEAFASTKLPDRPDYGWANEFLLKARRDMVK